MDTQLRKGLLDVCVLAAIKESDSYGYKIIKDLNPIITLSESTLYTILKRLIEVGMVTSRNEDYEGRTRRYYRITELGIERLNQFKIDGEELLKVYKFIMGENL